MTDLEEDVQPNDPKRVKAFASFFKRYMGISSIVTATLPIPITSIGLIPTFDIHKGILSTYTSLFCFLVLAFIFFRRHKIAKLLFGDRLIDSKGLSSKLASKLIKAMPGLLIALSLACVLSYHYILEIDFLDYAQGLSQEEMESYNGISAMRSEFFVVTLPTPNFSVMLIGLYIGIFVCAEAAFLLMALKEYLQDILGLTDRQLLRDLA